jgi:hypothetical protein
MSEDLERIQQRARVLARSASSSDRGQSHLNCSLSLAMRKRLDGSTARRRKKSWITCAARLGRPSTESSHPLGDARARGRVELRLLVAPLTASGPTQWIKLKCNQLMKPLTVPWRRCFAPARGLCDGSREVLQKIRGGENSDPSFTPFDTSGLSHQLNIAARVIC